MRTVAFCTLVLLGLSGGLAASPLDRADERALRKTGLACTTTREAPAPDETHSCYFSPGKFGERDFSVRATRAMQVVTQLGPDCDEIEILTDEEFTREGDSAPSLRRVRVKCTG